MSEVEKKLLELANDAQAFAAEQLPLYGKELLAWLFWSNVFCVIVAALLLIPLIALSIIAYRYAEKERLPDPFPIFGGVASVLGAVYCVLTICICSYEAVKVSVAPRVAIIEHLTGARH